MRDEGMFAWEEGTFTREDARDEGTFVRDKGILARM